MSVNDPTPQPLEPNRIAVLGACGGIGRALVTACLARGDTVCALDLDASLSRHPPPAGVVTYAVDATNEATLKTAFTDLHGAWGHLNGFVNLCGFMHDNAPVDQIDLDIFDQIVDGNLRAVLAGARHALPLLREAPNASMVNAASGLAQFVRPGFGAYAAAKAGAIALTKTLALENAPGVRVNAIAPAAVDTAFLRGGTGRSNEDDAVHLDLDAYVAAIPLQRMAVVDDIVGPMLFLLGPQSRYMTGQVLWLNGGAYMP